MSSHIQVELDAINQFPFVARASGLSLEVVYRGMIDLWAHCYRHKIDRVRLAELRGMFGPCEGLVDALQAFNFAEPLEDGTVLVRGTGRYIKLAENRREAGKRGGEKSAETRTSKQPPSKPQATAKQTQTKSQATAKQTPSKQASEGHFASSVLEQNQALDPRSNIPPLRGGRDIGEDRESSAGARKPGPPPHGGQAAPAMEPPAKSYEQLVAEWDPCGLEPDPRHDWDGPIEGCGTKGHRPYKRATRHPDGVIQYHTCPQCAADSFERVRKAREAKEAQARSEARWDRRAQMPKVPRPPDDAPEDEHMAWAIQQSAWLRWVETGEDKPAENSAGVAA